MFFIGGITQGTKELIYNAAAMIWTVSGVYDLYVPVLFLYYSNL